MVTNEEYLDRLLQAALHPELNFDEENEAETEEAPVSEAEEPESGAAEAKIETEAKITLEDEMMLGAEKVSESEEVAEPKTLPSSEDMGSIATAREAEFQAMSDELSFASLEAELQSELGAELEDMDLDAMAAELASETESVMEEEPAMDAEPDIELDQETGELPSMADGPEIKDEMESFVPEMETADFTEESMEDAEASLDALLGELGLEEETPAEGEMPSLNSLMGELGSGSAVVSEPEEKQEETGNLEKEELSDILDMLSDDDGELAEINDLLNKSDNHELVEDNDMLALLGGLDEEEEKTTTPAESESVEEAQLEEMQEEVLEEVEEKTKKKKWGKKKKEEPKEEAAEEASQSEEETEEVAFVDSLSDEEGESIDVMPIKEKEPAKAGLFQRLMRALLEEEEEEEKEEGLEDLEEEILGKKAKKDKKKKGKKGKKGGSSNDEILDEMNEEDGAKKKAKKKPKKEKPPKKEKVKEPAEPGKKLPKKMIIRIFVLCFSIMAIVILFSQLMPRFIHLSEARNEFYRGNYEEAYEGLVGRKLSDGDTILLQKSKILAQLSRKTEAYEAYLLAGDRAKALNELLEGVAYYADQADMIAALGIQIESDMAYSSILLLLQGEFSISEAQAYEIIALDPIDYTYMVRGLAGGDHTAIESTPTGEVEGETPSGSQEGENADNPEPVPELEDVLPGELD